MKPIGRRPPTILSASVCVPLAPEEVCAKDEILYPVGGAAEGVGGPVRLRRVRLHVTGPLLAGHLLKAREDSLLGSCLLRGCLLRSSLLLQSNSPPRASVYSGS